MMMRTTVRKVRNIRQFSMKLPLPAFSLLGPLQDPL